METADEYLSLLSGEKGQQPVDADADVVELRFPPWFDAERFRKGQDFHRKYFAGSFSGMLMGLVSILAIPSILKVLVCTRKSGTSMDAYKRYVETIYHTITWIDSELTPGSKAWQSLEAVRKKHFFARKYCEKAEKITINQRDMAITQFGFMGYIMLRPKIIGIHNASERDINNAIYFWRVLGYMVGILDEFNICTESPTETINRAKVIHEKFLRPALENPLADFGPMTQALTDGLWHYSYYLNGTVSVFFAKQLAGCNGYEYFDSDFGHPPTDTERDQMVYYKCTLYQRFMISLAIFIHQFQMKFAIFRWYYNYSARRARLINYYLPISAIFTFGFKRAYVRIFRSEGAKNISHDD